MDVTRENFDDLFPEIRKAIKDSAYISIDGEFTGLSTSTLHEPTLFDTPEIRYEKLKKSLSNFALCQCGISMFIPDESNANSYKAHTFNFFLSAPSFGPIDGRFLCQASALEFLTLHNFDFNACFKHGVSYMNKDQDKLFWQYHKRDYIQHNISTVLIRQYDEKYINPALAEINKFLNNNKNDGILEIDFVPKGLCQYILLKTVEKTYTTVSCYIKTNGKIIVEKKIPEVKFNFEEQYGILAKQVAGFSSVIYLISESRKPLIGHNMLGDLIFIYGLFYHSLPDTFFKFKTHIHELFPIIYDTKHIAFTLRKEFKDVDFFAFTSLEDLYNVFSSSSVLFYKLYTPRISHAEGFSKYNNSHSMHEAGYDAYLTGYLFLRLAHLDAAKNVRSTESQPLELEDHLNALNRVKNHVNVARAAVRYLNFGGKDPPINLPERFFVTLKNSSKIISANQVAQDFLPFGSVDVQLKSQTQALVAVSYMRGSRDVVRAFSRNKYYNVVLYNWWYHSEESKSIILFGSIGTSVVILFGVLYVCFRKSGR